MKKTKTPTAVTSLVFTLITIFFWAGFEVYRTFALKPVPPVPEPVIRPLDPTLDVSILNSVPQRLFFEDSEIGNTQVSIDVLSGSPIPSPTETPFPIATESSSPIATSTPTATASATP